MKKIICILLSLFLLTGCSLDFFADDKDNYSGRIEVNNVTDINTLLALDMPASKYIVECDDVHYYVIDNKIGEVDFIYKDHEYIFKGSRTTAASSLLGISKTPLSADSFAIYGTPFTFFEYKEGLAAVWEYEDAEYSIFGKDLSEKDGMEFRNVTSACANVDVEDFSRVSLPAIDDKTTKDSLEIWFSKNGFVNVDYEYQESDTVAADRITGYSKTGMVSPYDHIIVFVSSGPSKTKKIVMPKDLLNSSEVDFIYTVKNLGLEPVKDSAKYYSNTIKKDNVFSYDDGTYVIGSKVKYNLSAGQYSFDEDDYNNYTFDEIKKMVNKLNNLNANIYFIADEYETSEHSAGRMYDCSSSKDGYRTNISCKLAIKPSPQQVDLPNYVGSYSNPCGVASSCTFNQVNYIIEKVENSNPSGYICGQNVPAGKVNIGSTVTLTVSTGQPYLYRNQSGHYDQFIGESPEETESNLRDPAALGIFTNVSFIYDQSGNFEPGCIISIEILKDGEYTTSFESGTYPSTTPIKVTLADRLLTN